MVVTTVLFMTLIAVAQHWAALGWVVVVLGNLHIFEILSLNLITVVFGYDLVDERLKVFKRAHFQLISLGFSFVNIVLSFAFMYQFFDAETKILSQHSGTFLDYLYYSLTTMSSLGDGSIVPVTALGRLLTMYEIVVSLFFLLFVVAGVLGRMQQRRD